MPWLAGTVADLLAQEQYKSGVIPQAPFVALATAARQVQPAADCPNPRTLIVLNAVSAQQTAITGAGRLYRVRVENLTASAIFALVSDAVDAQIIAAAVCPARISTTVPSAAEAVCFGDPVGCGIAFGTSLRVRAFLLDGTGITTAAAGVTVRLLVGP